MKWIKDKIKWLIFLIFGIGIAFASPLVLPENIGNDLEVVEEIETIRELLVDKTVKEKANIKAEEIVKLDLIGEYNNTKYGIRVEIQSINKIEEGIEIFARAWKNNKPIGFGSDGTVEIERFLIYNPPILVSDSNGDIIREWTDIDTGELKQRRLREDPIKAIQGSLAHTIEVVKKIDGNIVEGKIGNTISTFHSAAGEVEPFDGFPRRLDDSAGWVALRDGNENGGGQESNAEDEFAQLFAGSTDWGILQRSIFGFDTSIIGDDTISSAIFSVYVTSKIDNFSQSLVVDRQVPIDSSKYISSQFPSTNWDAVDQADRITFTDITTSSFNDFTLNATGLGNINKSGNSWFALRFSGDIDDVEPTYVNSSTHTEVQGYQVDQTGTNEDPKLVVIHISFIEPPTSDIEIKGSGIIDLQGDGILEIK